MSGSLNDGVELQDEIDEKALQLDALLFEDPQPGEQPEIDDSVAITTSVNKLQDLGYLKADIRTSGGMNQTFALEAERIMPGFLGPDRPVGYFTMLPTATLYKVALEEISEEQKVELENVVKVFGALVTSAPAKVKALLDAVSAKNEGPGVFGKENAVVAEYLKTLTKAFGMPESVQGSLKELLKDSQTQEVVDIFVDQIGQDLAIGKEQLVKFYENLNQHPISVQLVLDKPLVDRVFEQAGHIATAIDTLFSQVNVVGLLGEKITAESVKAVAAALGPLIRYFQASEANTIALASPAAQLTVEDNPLESLFESVMELPKSVAVNNFLVSLKKAVEQLQAVSEKYNGQLDNVQIDDVDVARAASALVHRVYAELSGMIGILRQACNLFSTLCWIGEALQRQIDQLKKQVHTALDESKLPEADAAKVLQYFSLGE